MELGSERIPARATTAEGVERDRLWKYFASQKPFLAEHERRAGRQIPVVILERGE